MSTAPHQQFSPHPLLPIAIAFAAGTVLIHLRPLNETTILVTGTGATIACLVAVRFNRCGIATVMLITAFSLAGATYAASEQHLSASRLNSLIQSGRLPVNEVVIVTGTVAAAPEFGPES